MLKIVLYWIVCLVEGIKSLLCLQQFYYNFFFQISDLFFFLSFFFLIERLQYIVKLLKLWTKIYFYWHKRKFKVIPKKNLKVKKYKFLNYYVYSGQGGLEIILAIRWHRHYDGGCANPNKQSNTKRSLNTLVYQKQINK